MRKPTILVAGASGKTGSATVLALLGRGFPVRALFRAADRRSEALARQGAEAVVGNLNDLADLRRALDGVQRAYFCPPWAPGSLATGATFAVAAQEKRLEVVVVMSQWLADPLNRSIHSRETWLADRVFSWIPDVDTVFVNPGWFADNYMAALGMIAQLGMMVMPLGQGLNAPPSNEDIGSVVAGILADPAPHIGRSYRPTGPALLSPNDIAEAFGRALGRRVVYRDAPIRLFSKVAKSLGYPDYQIAQIQWYFEEYKRNAFGLGGPTDVVRSIGGREPEDFETTVRRYAASAGDMRRGLGPAIKALLALAKAMLTPAPDLEAFDRTHDFPRLLNATLAVESAEWAGSHTPKVEVDASQSS